MDGEQMRLKRAKTWRTIIGGTFSERRLSVTSRQVLDAHREGEIRTSAVAFTRCVTILYSFCAPSRIQGLPATLLKDRRNAFVSSKPRCSPEHPTTEALPT